MFKSWKTRFGIVFVRIPNHEILVETPSYTWQCIANEFMDCMESFNEETPS